MTRVEDASPDDRKAADGSFEAVINGWGVGLKRLGSAEVASKVSNGKLLWLGSPVLSQNHLGRILQGQKFQPPARLLMFGIPKYLYKLLMLLGCLLFVTSEK